MNRNKKDEVHNFWNNASCGEDLYLKKILPNAGLFMLIKAIK